MPMDPNKRGNPPFEPSSYAAGLERRVRRHNEWSQKACQMALALLDGDEDEKRAAEQWWREHFNQPVLVTSTA